MNDMKKQNQRITEQRLTHLVHEKYPVDEAEENAEIRCRCEETKGKTITQMLKLIVNDLKFWKK